MGESKEGGGGGVSKDYSGVVVTGSEDDGRGEVDSGSTAGHCSGGGSDCCFGWRWHR